MPLAPSHESIVPALVGRNPGQNPAERDQTLTHPYAAAPDPELPDRVLVQAGALLDHRGGAPDLPTRLEEAQQQDGVAEIGQVQRRSHMADHAGLGQDQDRHDALLVQVREQLVHLQDHELLVGHGVQVPAQAVDEHYPCSAILDGLAHHP